MMLIPNMFGERVSKTASFVWIPAIAFAGEVAIRCLETRRLRVAVDVLAVVPLALSARILVQAAA